MLIIIPFNIASVSFHKVIHSGIVHGLLVYDGDILMPRIFRRISAIFRGNSAVLPRIFRRIGLQTVQFFSREKVYLPSVYRAFCVNLIPSVLIYICRNASANFVSVLVSKAHFIIQSVS